MAVTAQDIIGIMKEAGIDNEVVDQLKPDVPLLRQGLDSIDLPIVAIATEKKYGIDLSNANATQLKTLNDFVIFVNQRMK